MEKIYIIGAGGLGREIAWLIEEINNKKPTWEIIGFIDENKDLVGEKINGYKVLGNIEYLNSLGYENVALSIGDGKIREKIKNKIKNKKYPILLHPDLKKSKYINIGEGTIICSGNILTVNIEIGKFVILNLLNTIGHDVFLEDYVTVLPGVKISGNVTIGAKTTIGTGTTIIEGISIGNESFIGAGALVNKNILNNFLAVGVPARSIKKI